MMRYSVLGGLLFFPEGGCGQAYFSWALELLKERVWNPGPKLNWPLQKSNPKDWHFLKTIGDLT